MRAQSGLDFLFHVSLSLENSKLCSLYHVLGTDVILVYIFSLETDIDVICS